MRIDLREISVLRPIAPAGPANLHLLGLFVVLNVADVLLTHLNVSLGLGVESNPMLLMVIERFSWAGIYWFKVIGPLVLTGIILHDPDCHLMASRWFSNFLAFICLVSLTGVCSGIWVSAMAWMN